jgi:hypothetical protein
MRRTTGRKHHLPDEVVAKLRQAGLPKPVPQETVQRTTLSKRLMDESHETDTTSVEGDCLPPFTVHRTVCSLRWNSRA